MKIVKQAAAGTFESSDAYVTAAPADTLTLKIDSVVLNQYGDKIKSCAAQTLADLGVTEGLITIIDKGAIDCVIAARIETAVRRAGGEN